MKNDRNKPLVIETRETMPEMHTTRELYEMAKEHFNRKCDAIEKSFFRAAKGDDQYTILTCDKDYMVSHEHILAHHVLSSYKGTPGYVQEVLEKALDKCIKEETP